MMAVLNVNPLNHQRFMASWESIWVQIEDGVHVGQRKRDLVGFPSTVRVKRTLGTSVSVGGRRRGAVDLGAFAGGLRDRRRSNASGESIAASPIGALDRTGGRVESRVSWLRAREVLRKLESSRDLVRGHLSTALGTGPARSFRGQHLALESAPVGERTN
jgi:hypothetical protein